MQQVVLQENKKWKTKFYQSLSSIIKDYQIKELFTIQEIAGQARNDEKGIKSVRSIRLPSLSSWR